MYLCRHNLGIVTGYIDSGIETTSVMAFHNVTAVHPVGADAAVVRTLRSRESIFGPTKRMVVLIQKGVLLFNSEPGLLIFGSGKKVSNLYLNEYFFRNKDMVYNVNLKYATHYHLKKSQ